jgi:hypothetical protein
VTNRETLTLTSVDVIVDLDGDGDGDVAVNAPRGHLVLHRVQPSR